MKNILFINIFIALLLGTISANPNKETLSVTVCGVQEIADKIAEWTDGSPLYVMSDENTKVFHVMPIDVYQKKFCHFGSASIGLITKVTELVQLVEIIGKLPLFVHLNKKLDNFDIISIKHM